MKTALEKLITLGKRQGFLTYAQANEFIPANMLPEQLDEYLLRLQNEGIELIDEDDPKEAKPQPTPRQLDQAQWIACGDPIAMLEHLHNAGGETSLRKLKLFGVSCCRQVWHLLTDTRSRDGVEAVELFAEGKVSEEQLRNQSIGAYRAWEETEPRSEDEENPGRLGGRPSPAIPLLVANARTGGYDPEAEPHLCPHRGSALFYAADAVCMLSATGNPWGVMYVASQLQQAIWFASEIAQATAVIQAAREQAQLLRDIVGSPFHHVSSNQASLPRHAPSAKRIAQAIYEECRFADLPIVADALEEAGCTEELLLTHCREPNGHVRGCWALDLLLGMC
jgi:hypothetical protein